VAWRLGFAHGDGAAKGEGEDGEGGDH